MHDLFEALVRLQQPQDFDLYAIPISINRKEGTSSNEVVPDSVTLSRKFEPEPSSRSSFMFSLVLAVLLPVQKKFSFVRAVNC